MRNHRFGGPTGGLQAGPEHYSKPAQKRRVEALKSAIKDLAEILISLGFDSSEVYAMSSGPLVDLMEMLAESDGGDQFIDYVADLSRSMAEKFDQAS